MLQRAVSYLPPRLVNAVGQAQFRYPVIRRAADLVRSRLTGNGTISHGPAAGLQFDATGGYPGYLLGTSEPEEQAFLANHLAAGDVFYDIGANIGFHSTLAARLVGPTGRVYAFEPHQESADAAAANAARNGFSHVSVMAAAVSRSEGRLRFASGVNSAHHHLAEDSEPGIEVEVVAIDTWVVSEGARPPTVILIDVEGAEMDVLAGMRETLIKHRPLVCCEIHWLGKRFLDFCQENLADVGYTVTNLHGGDPMSSDHYRWHAVLRPDGLPVATPEAAPSEANDVL
jgi:FkbM family methyltransferase